eukprot:6128389-Prorocentrum_lima.AAC.1
MHVGASDNRHHKFATQVRWGKRAVGQPAQSASPSCNGAGKGGHKRSGKGSRGTGSGKARGKS